MKKPDFTCVTRIYKSSAEEIFRLIEKGVLFKLTGADEIAFDFRERGTFSFSFKNRGNISGEFARIIPNEKIVLKWNVNGFEREDESTKVDISITEKTAGVSVTVSHYEIKSEKSATAKQKAWAEILLALQMEL